MMQGDLGGRDHASSAARCARHVNERAQGTCNRCGSFMCGSCSQGALCSACVERTGGQQALTLSRYDWSFGALWRFCFHHFQRDWVMISVMVLVSWVISLMVQAAIEALAGEASPVLTQVSSAFAGHMVQGILGLGLMRALFGVLQGGRAQAGQLFSQLHKAGAYAVTAGLLFLLLFGAIWGGVLLIGSSSRPVYLGALLVLTFLRLLAFLVPLLLLPAELACNDGVSPVQAIRNCYAYARDQESSVFGIYCVSVLLLIPGALVCGVGILPAMGLGELLMAGLYLTLRKEEAHWTPGAPGAEGVKEPAVFGSILNQ